LGTDFDVEITWSSRGSDGFEEAGRTGDKLCREVIAFVRGIEGLRHILRVLCAIRSCTDSDGCNRALWDGTRSLQVRVQVSGVEAMVNCGGEKEDESQSRGCVYDRGFASAKGVLALLVSA
jgi:hypothetical protein